MAAAGFGVVAKGQVARGPAQTGAATEPEYGCAPTASVEDGPRPTALPSGMP